MSQHPVSRRRALKAGLTALGGAAVVPAAPLAQAPAIATGSQVGRRFRALVGNARLGLVEELRLSTIGDRHVVVRTEASAPCYTMVMNGVGGTPSIPPAAPAPAAAGAAPGGGQAPAPSIANHTFVGIVDAVGSSVRRVRPGDRVIVGVTSYCGTCYQCLRGRADHCQYTFAVPTFPPFATRENGQVIGAALGIGGLSEVNVVLEEYVCPVFTDVPATQLSLLGDTVATGVAAAMNLVQIEPGSDVVVMGAGAIGSSAVQAARIMGAGQIIAVEPIRHRRELAQRLGATTVLDPNVEGAGLVERVRELCKGPTDRIDSGGRGWATTRQNDNRGPDITIEAVGRCGDWPTVERPPDPTGIQAMQQAWEMTRRGGSVVYLGFGQPGNVTYPASNFANRGRNVLSGQQGGLNMMRDLPRYVRLIERDQLDLRPIVTSTWRLDQVRQALQVLSDRTEMCPVVTFT